MLILLIFAFISGLVTIAAPCIWPLLPIILSSSATGGRGKPLGVTLGIVISFAVFTLTISYLVKLLHLDPNFLRMLAVIIIGFLGLSLLVPQLSVQLEVFVSKFSSKLNLTSGDRNGFWGGLLTGLSLGVVWSPCAGPILATIATLAITTSVDLQTILVTVSYCLGVGIPLFLLSKASNTIFARARSLTKYTGRIQQIFGLVMILTALAIFTNFDKVLAARLLDAVPSYSKYLNQLESNPALQQQLDKLKGNKAKRPVNRFIGKPMGGATISTLPDFGPAPEFTGISKWLNLDDGRSTLSLGELRGKVVLVDFWTYTCINCIRTLPYITSWYDKYHDKGFVVVGVHTPEFEFEKNTSNVEGAIKQFNIQYPVAQDNDYGTWRAYQNQYWPAHYLIDAKGHVRQFHFGEGKYDETEMAIKELLDEAGMLSGQAGSDSLVAENISEQTPKERISPETYLGAKRMEYLFPGGAAGEGKKNFDLVETNPINSFSLGGDWEIGQEHSTPLPGATLSYHFDAKKVFLVMGSAGKPARIRVYLDGSLLQNSAEVQQGIVTVDKERLYTLIELPQTEEHNLKLEFIDGRVKLFAFTFG